MEDPEFSPDDQLIGNSDIRGVKLRSAADGSLLKKIANAVIVSIAFSPDGTLNAGASPNERAVKIWASPMEHSSELCRSPPTFNFPALLLLPLAISSSRFTVHRTPPAPFNSGGCRMAEGSAFWPSQIMSTTSPFRRNPASSPILNTAAS